MTDMVDTIADTLLEDHMQLMTENAERRAKGRTVPLERRVRCGVDMKIVCMLYGGPERTIVDGKGKKWRFEDHHYCGPIVLTGKTEEIAENQPPENSPFWDAVNLWYAQGKRTKDPMTGEIWCVWDKPTMRKMRHIGGNHYELVADKQASNAKVGAGETAADSERLEWLMRNVSGEEFRRLGVTYGGNCGRDRIDAAMKPHNDKAQGAGGGLIAGGSPGAVGCAAKLTE